MTSELEPTTDPDLAPEARPDELAIEVRNVSKAYRLPTQRVDTLKERFAHPFRRIEYRELQALHDVSFDVARGEFFGITGRNGSGKSSLLKLLASIYKADGGSIRMAGRVAPFIELGVGFNLELSAHDNIVLNGVMMGLTPREARRRFDEVVDFAELGEFSELKLKNYSSGMLVRLGFSLLTQVDADVLLIDEVLAVGDAAFQQKSFDAFYRLHREGRTIVLVTHDMGTVESLCDRAMLLESGVVTACGDPGEVARRYMKINFDQRRAESAPEDIRIKEGPELMRFLGARVVGDDGETVTSIESRQRIRFETTIEALARIERPTIGFQIHGHDGVQVFAPNHVLLEEHVGELEAGERVTMRVSIDNPLAAGHYYVHVVCGRVAPKLEAIAFRKNAVDFVVFGGRSFGGVVSLEHEVTFDKPR